MAKNKTSVVTRYAEYLTLQPINFLYVNCRLLPGHGLQEVLAIHVV